MKNFLLFVESRDRFAVGLFRQFRIEETPTRVLIITPTLEYKRWVLEYIKARLTDYGKEILVKAKGEEEHVKNGAVKDGLQEKYSFENFVVGSSNELAYRISLEISSSPGSYSPLFIYGGAGLGKTHLLHAIGNRAKSLGYRAVYRQATEFSEDMIKSLKQGKVEEFRELFSGMDFLLLDDVQFLSGKERTQIELFRVFESLQARERQIVLVSDRHPKDIEDISQRLISRFVGGVVIEIGLDEETKLFIVKSKLLLFGLPLEERYVDYVMKNTGYSVREIEGFIKTLKLTGIREDRVEVKEKGEELLLFLVAKHFDLKAQDLKKDTRERKVLNARHIAMYFCKSLLNMSYSDIGRLFGKADHTSALYAIKKVEEKRQSDRKFEYLIQMLEKRLKKSLGLV